jgi:hypothetical protein
MISTLIALPYEIARLPLTLVDSKLADRLPETSAPRVTLDRAIGSADKLVGAVLRNREIAERGTDRLDRTDKLVAAARLEQTAAERREEAAETIAEGHQEAAQKRKAAQDRAASGLDEAAAAEARGKQEAKAKADQAAAVKKAAADKRAANRTETAQQRKKIADSAAEAKKQAEQRKAQAERDEARKTEQEAAEARDDAELLDDLVEEKKQERQQD